MELAACLMRLVFRLCSLFPQQRKIVLLSRQSARPLDFVLLEPELARRFPDRRIVWSCVTSIGEMSLPLMLSQIWHVATAELCLVDGYVPAVSTPYAHRCVVVQVWHALGAIKRFGYQSLDTPAGRSSRAARTLRMHRGYDLVVAGLPGAVASFSEAFDIPAEKILPLGLPRVDYLLSPDLEPTRSRRFARAGRAAKAAFSRVGAAGDGWRTVVYAPTFRKANADSRWLEHAVTSLCSALAGTSSRLLVAGHPLDDLPEGAFDLGTPVVGLRGVATIDLLHLADFVVTDYSTVAFEAGFAGCRVLFFVPDIDEYRLSPGLNVDPLVELSTVSFVDAAGVAGVVAGTTPYDAAAFESFMARSAQGVGVGAIERISDVLERGLSRVEAREEMA